MTIDDLNKHSSADIFSLLQKCCGAESWVRRMIHARPYQSVDHLISLAIDHWQALSTVERLEAFKHHPRIGDLKTLSKKYHNTANLASEEQSLTQEASESTLKELADYNHRYVEKFGFIFIICATGKSAAAMLKSLKDRIGNQREQEIRIASEEQIKITCLRLKKLIE
jgi:2-oxo-4-hydroxy-4-carboxy-5-ureidoimidazoline decarboxylase